LAVPGRPEGLHYFERETTNRDSTKGTKNPQYEEYFVIFVTS